MKATPNEKIPSQTLMFVIEFISISVSLRLFSFGVAFIFYSVVLTKMKLGVAYPIMTSAGFAIVTVAAVFLFDERLSAMKLMGIAVIAVGIWLVAIAK